MLEKFVPGWKLFLALATDNDGLVSVGFFEHFKRRGVCDNVR